MSILVIIFPFLLGVTAAIYFGGPKTRAGLWGFTACSVVSLVLILSMYNLTALQRILNDEHALLLLEGLFFTLLFSLPFTLPGWAKEAIGVFRGDDELR